MKNHLALIVMLMTMLLPSWGSAQTIDAEKQLDNMITQGMQDWQIPGMTAIVVKNNEVVFQKVYGVKNLETREPVDENTLFNMGSTTKAIVCMALGILVDQGKLKWTDKVRQHLPYFTLSDAYITEEARVQDLLTHNLGIEGADLLWFMDSVSTKETIERYRFAEKTYPIRGGFAYNNLMYAVAGEVITQVSGQHWSEFVKKEIFEPLQMTHTKALASELFEDGNYVTPYLNDIEDGIVQVNYNLSDQIGAAGMIWSCAGDIANYLTFLTNDGVFNNDTILSPATFSYLFQPQAMMPYAMYPTEQLSKPNWRTYGLGWFQRDYRGVKLDFHSGSISGLIAIAGIMHDKDVAVYILANLDHAELRHAILFKAMDLYAFEDDTRDWNKEVFQLYEGFRQRSIEANKKFVADRVAKTKPTLPLDAYQGVYENEMLGKVSVSVENKQLKYNVNDFLVLINEHWHYDTFRSDKNNRYRSRFVTQFHLNERGQIAELEMAGNTFKKIN